MPFIGEDWRSPGHKWVRTEGGWKPLSDLGAQIVNHLRNWTPTRSSGARNRSRSRSRGNTRSRNSPQAASGRSTPEEEDKKSASCKDDKVSQGLQTRPPLTPGGSPSSSEICLQERDERLKELHFLLSMKCVSVCRASSRESNRYSTISDAVQKLNFHLALQDENCFPFICEVLVLIFEDRYQSSSGSLQSTLLGITDTAKEIAISNRQHSGLVLKVIHRALAINEKIRKSLVSGYALRNTDSKIKSLLKMKRQLQESQLQPTVTMGGTTQLLDLPNDCLYFIMSYLAHPKDVLNLGETNSRLHDLTEGNKVWRELTYYQYGKPSEPEPLAPWSEIFINQYKLSSGKLRGQQSYAVCICKTCKHVFWKSYGHPCCVGTSEKEPAEEIQIAELESLTPQKFMHLFPH